MPPVEEGGGVLFLTSQMNFIVSELVPSIAPSRLTALSLPHVVPDDNVLAFALTEGPSGRTLEFSAATRADDDMV
jgi:hypothetical protein